MQRIPVLSVGYQLRNSPFYSVLCIYLLLSLSLSLSLSSFLLKHKQKDSVLIHDRSSLHQTALVNRAAPQHIAGVLPATCTTVIGTFQLAPRATLGSVPRMVEAAGPPVSVTADGDWHAAMTLGASPYL
jgi:hypothetical protein